MRWRPVVIGFSVIFAAGILLVWAPSIRGRHRVQAVHLTDSDVRDVVEAVRSHRRMVQRNLLTKSGGIAMYAVQLHRDFGMRVIAFEERSTNACLITVRSLAGVNSRYYVARHRGPWKAAAIFGD